MRATDASPVRVAHVATAAVGLLYLLLDQMLSLQAAGYDVTAISAPGPDARAVQDAGIRHIPVPMTRRVTPVQDLLSLRRLRKVFARERFDIVHTHNPKPGLLGQLAARAAGVPVVVNTVHGFYFHEHMAPLRRRFYVALEKAAARCSTLILSQNREDMATALREGICPADRIAHLGNGIDLQRFAPCAVTALQRERARREIGLPDGAKVVGFVGRLVAEKGLEELFEAAAIVRRRLPSVRFLFVGGTDGEKADALDPLQAHGLGRRGFARFVGHRTDMPVMYSLMDVLALPSHREGFPRAVMEASAMGVPCVVTDVRGCREAVEDGVNGSRVPLGDVPALADALVDILCDPNAARLMSVGGRRMALQQFDQTNVFDTVKSHYARLLADAGIRAPRSDGGTLAAAA